MATTTLPSPERATNPASRHPATALVGLVVVVVVLSGISLWVGAQPLSLTGLLTGDPTAWVTFTESRIPRTAAIVLAGAAMGIAGLIVQLLARNRFVEPSTIGSTDSAALALVLVSALAPAAPVWVKIVVGVVGAIAGTALFFAVISRFRHRTGLIIPLIGLVLGAVIGALTSFLAYRLDLVQALNSWMSGSFSGVIGGRYELLWLVLACAAIAWWAADRLTAAGIGETFARSIGINHTRVLAIGLVVVAIVSAIVVVVVGALPFLGLVIPNLVRAVFGDHLRRTLPWIALAGAAMVLAADLVARLVRYPYEIPVGLVMGIVGGTIFLVMLVRQRGKA